MGTSVFDRLWDPTPDPAASGLVQKGNIDLRAPSVPAASRSGSDALDSLWDSPPPHHDYHAEFASGALAKRMQGENARDAANQSDLEASQPGYLERLATHTLNTAQGIPGMRAVESAAGAIGTGGFDASRKALDTSTANIGGKTSLLEHAMGSLAIAPFLPGGAVKAGAVLGGADAALSADSESPLERLGKTALGAGSGAIAGRVAEGVGNVAQRSGLTDMLAAGLRKIGGRAADVGQAIGTTGAVNDLAQTRQTILDQLSGSEKSAAQTMIDHVDAYKAQAAKLYDVARQDKSVIADPRIRSALDDPRVEQIFQVTRQRLGLGPNPVTVAPNSPLAAATIAGHVGPGAPMLTAGPSVPPGRLVNAAGQSLMPSAPAQITVDLPTPEEIAMTKRLLNDVVTGKFQGPGISPAEAAQLVPKIDQLRSALHDASPPWKEADAYYAQAKNFETAFTKAFGAQQKVTAGGLDPSKLKSPDAIDAWVAKRAGTPIGDARAAGQQGGAASRVADAVKGAPLGAGITETLNGANGLLQPSAAAAAVRRAAFKTPQEAQAFADLLAKVRAQGVAQTDRAGKSASLLNPISWITKPLAAPENPLATPHGEQLRNSLAAWIGDPARAQQLRDLLASAGRGRDLTALLQRSGMSAANSSLANR